MLWPGAQQQPSGNGLRLLRELPVDFCHRLQGLDSNIPPLCLPAHLSSPVKMTPLQTVKDCAGKSAMRNFLCELIPHLYTVSNTQASHKHFYQIRYQKTHTACHSPQQGKVPRASRHVSHTHAITAYVPAHLHIIVL